MRPDIHTYFMNMAKVASTMTTCKRRQVGAIIVKDKQVLSTGYNGAPKNTGHCIDMGCMRDSLGIPSGKNPELCRAVHSEQNAIIQAALNGRNTQGATIYCTHQPCVICAKMIINAGITTVVYENDYPDTLAISLMKEAGLEIIKLKNENNG